MGGGVEVNSLITAENLDRSVDEVFGPPETPNLIQRVVVAYDGNTRDDPE